MRLDDLREQLEVDKTDYESRKRRALDIDSKFSFRNISSFYLLLF
jgi:hypothetical protein